MLLELERVSKRFAAPVGTGEGVVLREVSLVLGAGESMAIVGPSGSGKSTLLQIAGTLVRASSGGVRISGRDVSLLSEQEQARLRSEGVGFVFQRHHLLPQCSALENCLVPTLALRERRDVRACQADARRLLERVGLGARLQHRPGELSGGECQRVAVARALVNRPRLLLADEPTGALDRATALEVADLLVDLQREQGLALLVVTHSEELARRMRSVHSLVQGRLAPRTKDA